jgi:hypothetical protein
VGNWAAIGLHVRCSISPHLGDVRIKVCAGFCFASLGLGAVLLQCLAHRREFGAQFGFAPGMVLRRLVAGSEAVALGYGGIVMVAGSR